MEKFKSMMIMAAAAVFAVAAAGGPPVLAGPIDTEIDACEPGSYIFYELTGTFTTGAEVPDVYTYGGGLKHVLIANSFEEYFMIDTLTVIISDPLGNVIENREETSIKSSLRNEPPTLPGAVNVGTETVGTIYGDVAVNIWEMKENGGITHYYLAKDTGKCYKMVITSGSEYGTTVLDFTLKEEKIDTFRFGGDDKIGRRCTYGTSDPETVSTVDIEIAGVGSGQYLYRTTYHLKPGPDIAKNSVVSLSMTLMPESAEMVGTVTMDTVDGKIEAEHWRAADGNRECNFYIAGGTVYKADIFVNGKPVTLTLTEKNF